MSLNQYMLFSSLGGGGSLGGMGRETQVKSRVFRAVE